MCNVYAYSVVSNFANPWTVARQTPLSVKFSRQEYRSGLPFPPPGGLANPQLLYLLHQQLDSLPLSHQGNIFHLKRCQAKSGVTK